MKRMNEFFELPISAGDAYAYGFATIQEAAKIGRCPAAKNAAIAINNVDKLADALELLVSDYNQYRAVNEIDITDDHSAKLHAKMAAAELALAAYRGAP